MKRIGKEADRLAGLVAGLMVEYRARRITLSHLEWFIGLPKKDLDALMCGGKSTIVPRKRRREKFALLADLGVITVPDDYAHGMCLDTFFKKNGKKLFNYNKNITDANFSNPSRILKPGDRLRVRAFHQIVSGRTTPKERMNFLRKQEGNIYTGAQGAVLVFEQKRDQLPKGIWYASFDEAGHLWEDSDGYHGVPHVSAYSDRDFDVDLGYLENDLDDNDAFLSFSDFAESP